jgi:pyruvate/2-oxoglutarate dehydrogenase complex dihydrolipoamide dehydrogenase (E3) component
VTEWDLIVLGGGSAGFAAARVATEELGARVAVVDKGPLGGLCILAGCMPSKALIQSSNVAHLISRASTFGTPAIAQPVDFPALMARKDRLIQGFAEYRADRITTLPNSELFLGPVRFVDPHTVMVGDRPLSAPKFILALGSTPMVPPIPGLSEVGYLLSDQALNLHKQPESLLLVGGGIIALELGQFFARIGTRVTILEALPRLVAREDPEVSEVITQRLQREGVVIHTGVRPVRVERLGDRKAVTFETPDGAVHEVEGAEILVATGREPSIKGLDLDRAGVQMEGRRMVLDRCLRTTNPDIFAAGDVTGGSYLVHVAISDGELAARNALLGCAPKPAPAHLFLSAAFTQPNIARVGLSEGEAQQLGREVLVGRYRFADHGKAEILGETDGFVKMLADPLSGEILGTTIVGPDGAELIHEIACAMTFRATVEQFLQVPHVHPTLAEIWTYPAEEIVDQIRRRARMPSTRFPAGYNDQDEERSFEEAWS